MLVESKGGKPSKLRFAGVVNAAGGTKPSRQKLNEPSNDIEESDSADSDYKSKSAISERNITKARGGTNAVYEMEQEEAKALEEA